MRYRPKSIFLHLYLTWGVVLCVVGQEEIVAYHDEKQSDLY